MDLDVFISHSSRDTHIAEALIDLLQSGANVPSSRIRCTSVDGYRLPGGAKTDEQLRLEVRAATVFIGLITHQSVQSTYVLFELGARWGAGLHMAPVLAAGASPKLLGGPLAGRNALDCSNSSQMHQLVGEVAKLLGYTPASPMVYDRYVKQLNTRSLEAAATLNPT